MYEEGVPGEPQEGQTLVNIMDWTKVLPVVDDEPLDLLSSQILSYSRILDLRKGYLKRKLSWKTQTGKILDLEIIRLLSFSDQHTALISYQITPRNFSGGVTLYSLINGEVTNKHHLQGEKIFTQQEGIFLPEEYGYLMTQQLAHPSTLTACAVLNQLEGHQGFTGEEFHDDMMGYRFHLKLSRGEPFLLNKYCYLITSQDVPGDLVNLQAIAGVKRISRWGQLGLLNKQAEFLKAFWDRAHLELEGDPSLQQGIHYNLFQLLQSTGRDGKRAVAAKGLSGEFYEGHTFWDMEIYILPFFLYTWPQVARDLLLFRYQLLEKSRENARRFRDSGALFAWRTINGQEASSYFMGSSVQCHINAAVAYAIKAYHEVTEDDEFLVKWGGEILFETARYWAHRGYFSPRHGDSFVIHVVCGPDEYKPGVNNNCYTNYMAAFNLEYALAVASFLHTQYPEEYHRLREKMGLTDQELEKWQEAAQRMYRPFDEKKGIHPQDDSFLSKEILDVDSFTWEDIPLVRNWHPLVIWRYQVIKQADVILLMFLLGEVFTLQEKKANFDYYEPLTTHDSSLSPSIYSILASELGYHHYAAAYLRQTLRLDLDNYNGNTYQGLHMANMGSSWMVVTFGLAGMRNRHGTLCFNPSSPQDLSCYRFQVHFKGRTLQVTVREKGVTYLLFSGEPLSILHRGKRICLTCDPVTIS